MKLGRKVLFTWTLVTLAATLCPPCAWAQQPDHPNIVLVFIDDMGWTDLSCFGNDEAQTPNIDRMAAEGIAFERFYVNSPICSPSRVAISTGQYPQRWGITSYLAHRKDNKERGMAQWLDPRAPMLARTLQQHGYATGHFGKWHMGGQRDVVEAPPISEYGFDESLTNFEGMGAKLLPLTLKPGWDAPRRIWDDAERLGGPVTWMQRSEISGGFVDAAMQFIKTAQQSDKPFYINLWPDDVHSPFFPPVDNWHEGKRERYLAVLEAMDRQLGVLFDFVRQDTALRDNTLILICSDNGHEPGAGQAGPLKGCKTNLFEGGIRSPLIVWGPNFVAEQGLRNRESVFAAIDLVPSLIRFADAKPPPDVSYDGEDLLDTLLGHSNDSRKAPIFFGRPPDRKNFFGYENLPDLAVIDGNWKLLCDFDGGRPLLYDLAIDPGESQNVAESNSVVAESMTAKAIAWFKKVDSNR
jgi:uncharacterized sulfatase